ncbi:heme A synthase [Pseudoalteromonas piscicida]|uniref:Heme A synthase n=1 Tax=Pseudoalteromonas piscicida TaxID=43662 RepID=A0AAQ2EV39_PSEO7|nr:MULTISPECIES: COX15/CtaA family protein [Pseudoalteromonas]KJY90630.1 cytochrome B561 [Pseudoalteromonas piscicida]MDP4490749.1 COX15/CtaA family protein [Pseudoalteromonas piscicida]TMN34578.1 heme A synthase [Pseudoalteromonas piscicida]TMN40494.1 heme A synthase [Pseudoalteromonas piscicida]TMN47345.1 heme A synthase [Pseudoalteromonas piscicida]
MSKVRIKIAIFACFVAITVVTLGAFTRLSDAGLGCPDWPGCYGFLTVPNETHELSAAKDNFPHLEVEAEKAWIEMIHRYFASFLGLLILALACIRLFKKQKTKNPNRHYYLLLLLVLFQGALGMWTVTMNLQPVIVMGHLLGGFSILALLVLLVLRLKYTTITASVTSLTCRLCYVALGVLIIQIALGGWLAANYAAPHCTGLPLCDNLQLFSWQSLFTLPEASATYEFGVLPFESRVSIHFIHRIWAVITVLMLLAACWPLLKASQNRVLRHSALVVLALISIQVLVGAAIVHFQFPLLLTLFHNFMAAMVLLAMVRLCFFISLAQKVGVKYASIN